MDHVWEKSIVGPITVKIVAEANYLMVLFNNKNVIRLTAEDIITNNQNIELV